jgi:polyhydroxyalkanoate synthase
MARTSSNAAGPAGDAVPVTSDPVAAAHQFDSHLHALAAPLSAGLSPISMSLAFADWAMHLATQPAFAAWLAARAQQGAVQWWSETLAQARWPLPGAGAGEAAPNGNGNGTANGNGDARFAHPAWHQWPWPAVVNAVHAAEDWWSEAAALRGMDTHHQHMTRFFARQWLDLLSPSNQGWLNPEVLQATRARTGANLAAGALQAMDEWRRRQGLAPLQQPTQQYRPGVEVGLTPGQVVHRNHLVELIQYTPSTPQVAAEPVFIVPSWIMKFYILDLSPHNSMVKWLVDQGHTVFILSWRNPDEHDALLSMADYLELGVLDPLAAIARLVPGESVHTCGYCLGGTLLALAAAAIARGKRGPGGRGVEHAELLPPLQSVSLLAAEVDFSEPGEMGVLIDESQVTFLEDMMAERGFLTGKQMAGSFAYLHSRELVWSQRLRQYWLGEADQPNDLMAWNADVTRMPAAMHSEYLRRCYLRNEIAEGRFPVQGQPVSLSDIRQPMFVVGTEKDHVSPWKSVFKIHRLTDTDVTFVLTNGGHNAGIVSEPGHARRHYAQLTLPALAQRLSPEEWVAQAPRHEGSWWTAWHAWLLRQGSGRQVPARAVVADQALGPAPGTYVHQCYDD